MIATSEKNTGLDPRCGRRSRKGILEPMGGSCMRSVPPKYTVGPPAPAAGFRACKRCLPDQETPSTGLVRKVCKYIQEQSGESGSVPTLAELGRAIDSSPTHLQRVFKEATGVTPRQYASAWRLNRFKAMIKDGQDIPTAPYEAECGSSSRLYETSKEQMVMSPGDEERV